MGQERFALTENGDEDDRIIADCTAILNATPDDVIALMERGRTWYRKRNYENVIADFTEAIRLESQNAMAYIMRGLARQELGDYHMAIADYNIAIYYDRKSADAYHNRGNTWVCCGKLRKGIADFQRAIRLDPTNPITYTSRGVAWRRKGRYAAALADYERALELEPDSALGRAVLAEFLASCPKSRYRNGARALELITKACELTDYSESDYVGCLAAAHAELGDFAYAVSFQKKALTLATEYDNTEDMLRYLALYEAEKNCWMKPPTFRERWA